MTLTDFLLARLDEEILARWAAKVRQTVLSGPSDETLRGIACVYSDHPDYRQEWAP